VPRPALVTGAAGFFGLAIVRALTRDGVPVIATDRAPALGARSGTREQAVRYVRRDLTREPIDDLVAEATGVVHAAALTPADERAGETGDALLAVNLSPLPRLLHAVREAPSCGRLILISSAGVYDQARSGGLGEADADGGTGLYGAAKLAAELVAARYCSLYGVEYAALRPTSLFGAGELVRPSRTRVTGLAALVGHAGRGEPVRLERPDARADWLSVDDAAEAVAALWAAPVLDGRSYNLSAARPQPFSAVAAAVQAACGLVVAERAEHVVDGGIDRPAVIANARLTDALGWTPRRSLEVGARELRDYLREVQVR